MYEVPLDVALTLLILMYIVEELVRLYEGPSDARANQDVKHALFLR